MKSALGIVLISATLAMILLGGLMVSHNFGGHTQCPISALGGNECANIINPFEFAISHINTIIGLSAGIIVLPFIFLILAASMLFVLYISSASSPPQTNFFIYDNYVNKNQQIASIQKWLSWLSFLEKHDPLILAAAKT